MTKKFISILLSLVILVILFTFYKGLKLDVNYSTQNQIGKRVDNFKINSFDNKFLFSQEDLKKNDFSLINFWASWCSPCREEHKILMQLKKDNNITIIGVNFKDNKKNASNYLDELGNPYDFLLTDNDGKQSINFGIYGIPESILVDNNLIILKKYVGPLLAKDIKEIQTVIEK
tara:strand:- start:151 stop:672 length:522 start_codon:yes stop_codon:yes gene_type:complete